jgi:hypothetical protein
MSSGCSWRNDLQIWKIAANILNKQSRTADKGWSFSLGVGQGAKSQKPRNQTDYSVQPKQRKRDMRFGT